MPTVGWFSQRFYVKISIMTHTKYSALFFHAWVKLIRAYLVSFAASLAAGYFLIEWVHLDPQKLFEITTRRLAVAGSVFEKGMKFGIDPGILLFVWNSLGALATISFIYTASLINPRNINRFPRVLRKSLVGTSRMKALRFLPGCSRIEEEAVRRLYVWLMVPLLGIILLGAECGFIVSSATHLFGSYLIGIMSLVPHGVIEIPAFSLAGAVTFSAHLLVKETAGNNSTDDVFNDVQIFRNTLPIRTIALFVILCLLIAGYIEAHVTGDVVDFLFNNSEG
jgi:uncharacterized membrane protein SpoIIM required for sporulation